MKLKEILREDNIKHVQTKYLPNIEDGSEKIGTGAEANVYAGKDGASVIKELWVRGDVEYNATYQYIDMVMSHQNNPYFPRIYNAKLYTTKRDDNSYSKLIIQMEKLAEFNTSKTEHLLPQLISQMGITEEDILNMDSMQRMKDMKSGSHHQEKPSKYPNATPDEQKMAADRADEMGRKNMLRDIGGVLFSMFGDSRGRKELIEKSTNPELKEAIKLSGDIITKGREDNEAGSGHTTRGDLHEGNIMIRLTGHGPQLVITDPVISRGV